MDSADQVVFVLQLILLLGPLAVYFLGLGLVNSQAHPCVVNARVDFVLLTVAFVPVIVGPVVLLIQHGHVWIAIAVLAMVAGLFRAMLPERRAGWVVYNATPQQCRRLLERACRHQGWSMAGGEDRLHIAPVNLVVTHSSLPLLRNVTLRVRSAGGGDEEGESDRLELIDALTREVQLESMLPSPAGASLVVIGAALLGVPMWYLFHHMDAIVDVVRHFRVA